MARAARSTQSPARDRSDGALSGRCAMKLLEGRCWSRRSSAPPVCPAAAPAAAAAGSTASFPLAAAAPPASARPPCPRREGAGAGADAVALPLEGEDLRASPSSSSSSGAAPGDESPGGDAEAFPGECGASALLVPDRSLVSKLQGHRARKKQWRKRKRWTTGAVLLLVGGVANTLLGALSLVWTPFNLFMKERLNMRPGLPAYDWWVTPPPVVTSLYLFNVTNSEKFLSGEDDMLQIQEIGPVVYLELLTHKNVVFHPNGTLTYVGQRELVFQPNDTKVNINASLIVPNLAVLGIASFLHDASFFTKIGLSVLLRRLRAEPFSHITVYDYLWNYKDPLLEVARNLAPFLVPFNNIGILSVMYQEKEDEVTVHMGPGSERRFFTMDRYHGQPRFGYWRDERCDTVEGATEGVLYQEDIRRNDSLRYFRKAICRVAPITYAGDVLRDGIEAYRFELPDNFFDRFEDTSADCFAGDPSAPLVSGLSDCSPCYFNFPVAASAPHFLNGDPVLIDSVRGMNPRRDKHGSYIVVEPITGIPMESCARIQSNLVVRKLSGISKKVERFSNITIPMFWAEYYQKDLPWYVYYLLYFVVNILPDLQSWISFILVTSGIGLLIAGFTSVACAQEKRKNNSYKFLDLTPSSSCSSSTSS